VPFRFGNRKADRHNPKEGRIGDRRADTRIVVADCKAQFELHRTVNPEDFENAAWHIHTGAPPKPGADISFALLLNLVSAANVETKASLWRFISKYAPDVTPVTDPFLDKLVGHAPLAYHLTNIALHAGGAFLVTLILRRLNIRGALLADQQGLC